MTPISEMAFDLMKEFRVHLWPHGKGYWKAHIGYLDSPRTMSRATESDPVVAVFRVVEDCIAKTYGERKPE